MLGWIKMYAWSKCRIKADITHRGNRFTSFIPVQSVSGYIMLLLTSNVIQGVLDYFWCTKYILDTCSHKIIRHRSQLNVSSSKNTICDVKLLNLHLQCCYCVCVCVWVCVSVCDRERQRERNREREREKVDLSWSLEYFSKCLSTFSGNTPPTVSVAPIMTMSRYFGPIPFEKRIVDSAKAIPAII